MQPSHETPPAARPLTPELLEAFSAIVGKNHALTDKADLEPYVREWRDRYVGSTPLLLKPATTAEVSAILALASKHGISVVPQGGNTGLVGGQIPFGHEIMINFSRMNKIRHVDAPGYTITVEAGVTLQGVQEAAKEAGRLFPLSLAAEGSAQIGGNLATNAGGVHVLRYGNTRDLTLGLEVVLADGQVWNGLKALRKDNTGYDLRHLFIGSEGSLGFITAATLKLFPQPAEVAVAYVGVRDLAAVRSLFSLAQERAGPLLTAFELMSRIGIDFVLKHGAQARDPLMERHPWYVLMEISSPLGNGLATDVATAVLEKALSEELADDAVLAASSAQAQDFWRLRELMSEVQKLEGGSIKHDISVPVSSIPEFIEKADAAVEKLVPGARPVPFGHFGDGNVHYNVSQPKGADKEAYLARWEEMSNAVHSVALSLGGSISAEHGVGRMKAAELEAIKSPVEMDLMRRIKRAFDPSGILNPGKVVRG